MKDVHIELASDISIFVGANNSGKTSATQAIQSFLSSQRERFSLFDFSSDTWKAFDEIGELPPDAEEAPRVPSISIDLWFEVDQDDLQLVLPLLTSTAWEGALVGVRIEYCAKNDAELLANYRQAKETAAEKLTALGSNAGEYAPWPKSLTDYLQRALHEEFELRHYVLDRSKFDDNFRAEAGYSPLPLSGDKGGTATLRSIIRVDNLSAQRHLADPASGGSGTGRSEDLSKRLSNFYRHNLDQRQEDHSALLALFNSETELNKHLSNVFQPTLERLGKLGYPGVKNPRMVIKSALNPASVMRQDAQVHYILSEDDDSVALPDAYNGLGFKNLIYMVVELLDLHARWKAEADDRPPLHLIFIEEPEAHLHAQLQQVFIRNVLTLLDVDADDMYQSQLVVTTHSPHILYERGFKPIRYFRRHDQTTAVLNLSSFHQKTPADRDFLEKYLKLTHCDLFFSDAAILVEGNVERLLLPSMITKAAPSLRSACLSILEVGGAFGYRFKALIEFLGIVTLVVTDLDSVSAAAKEDDTEEVDAIEFEVPAADEMGPPEQKFGTACLPSVEGAVTSNQTLIQWLPKKLTVADLWSATPEEKLQIADDDSGSAVRVAYQTPTAVLWKGVSAQLCGRTLEESFGLENSTWCQDALQRPLGLRLRAEPANAEALAEGLHKRVNGSGFDKTRFALGVLTQPLDAWVVPTYIAEGLLWLKERVDLEAPTIFEVALDVEVAAVNEPQAEAAE